MLAVVICINHVMLIKEFTWLGRKLKTATNKTLVSRFRHFFAQSLQTDFKTHSQYLFRVRGLQEKCVSILYFFFSFSEETVRSGALEIQPISLSVGVYGKVEVSRLPPAERPWGLLYSCLITD